MKLFPRNAIFLFALLASASLAKAYEPQKPCFATVLEGTVRAGQGFDKVFTPGLRFYLEPLQSGWIVRILDANAPRGAHDFAELATPPYQSVSPLLISTDWAFRAQDAVAWNPRHFRFAESRKIFSLLEQLQPRALQGDAKAAGELASIAAEQPEATLELLDARFAPGTADQWRMASAVSLNLATTPHEVDSAAAPSPLGKLESIHFRVLLHLPPGARAASGVDEHASTCGEPTTISTAASQLSQRNKKK